MRVLAVDHSRLWPSRTKDAAWLARRIRSSRLTVLQGQPGTGKTALLLYGVLPRLQRRASDPPHRSAAIRAPNGEHMEAQDSGMQQAPPGVIPFPDRRRLDRHANSLQGGEVVVYQDDWSTAPLDALSAALHSRMDEPMPKEPLSRAALRERLTAWHQERGVRFLIVMDDFDVLLKASIDDPEAGEFVDLWVQLLSDESAPAHFLVSTTEPAEPLWRLLEPYVSDQGDLREHRLQLAGVSLAPALVPASQTSAPAGEEAATSSRERAADDAEDPAAMAGKAVINVDASGPDDESLDGSDEPLTDSPPEADRGERTEPSSRRWKWPAAAALVLITAGVLISTEPWTRLDDRESSSPASVAPQTPAPAPMAPKPMAATAPATDAAPVGQTLSSLPIQAASLPAPGFELLVEAGDGSQAVMSSELARLLTPEGRAEPPVRGTSGWMESLQRLAERPGLAMVSYDALQAARQWQDGPHLQIVTPLFSQEIYFVVRADSPLEYIHQIKEARLDVGPPDGERALVARDVYKRMFGSDASTTQLLAEPREAALARLQGRPSSPADGKPLNDVLVLVGAQPDPWLAGLAPSTKRGLRLLQLDPSHAASRQATAAFLPTRVAPANGSGLEPPEGARTLAVMSFLVASARQSDTSDSHIEAAANALCRNLPALKSQGHPKWREVRQGTSLETGWPTAPAATRAFGRCQRD